MSENETLTLNTWFPLVTEQLRLRGLKHIYLYHPTCQGYVKARLMSFYSLSGQVVFTS